MNANTIHKVLRFLVSFVVLTNVWALVATEWRAKELECSG